MPSDLNANATPSAGRQCHSKAADRPDRRADADRRLASGLATPAEEQRPRMTPARRARALENRRTRALLGRPGARYWLSRAARVVLDRRLALLGTLTGREARTAKGAVPRRREARARSRRASRRGPPGRDADPEAADLARGPAGRKGGGS